MRGRWWARGALSVAMVMIAVLLGTGGGSAIADPPPAPESSAPATSDPAPPASDEQGGGAEPKIKSGTAKEGTIHWEKFGGETDGAPETLDDFSKLIVGWALTLFGIFTAISSIVVCILMAIGFKGHSSVAKAALESSVWIVLGVVLVGSISTVAGVLVIGAGLA